MFVSPRGLRRALCLVAGLGLLVTLAGAAAAAGDEQDTPDFPTTVFADGAKTASVTVGDVTAKVSLERRPAIDPKFDVPVLTVTVGGKQVIEVVGVASGFDFPAAEASIAEIDPDNHHPEVYFTSFSGGAHCCSSVFVAEEVGDEMGRGEDRRVRRGRQLSGRSRWRRHRRDRHGRQPLSLSVRLLCLQRGAARGDRPCGAARPIDVTSGDPRYLPAHRDWLSQIEENVEPAQRWTSRGYLAGWVAAKAGSAKARRPGGADGALGACRRPRRGGMPDRRRYRCLPEDAARTSSSPIG